MLLPRFEEDISEENHVTSLLDSQSLVSGNPPDRTWTTYFPSKDEEQTALFEDPVRTAL